MFVYLDESGDTGFKFDKGSSRYFIVTILLTPDPLPLDGSIDELRESLGFPARYEFKFYRSRENTRLQFLRLLTRHDVLIRTLVVDKLRFSRPEMQERNAFYGFLVRSLLENDANRIRDATLILDQRDKGKKSKQTLATYLRRSLNSGTIGVQKIRDIRYHESHRDNLLQAVDMASGAINVHYARGNSAYLRVIRTRIDDIWELDPIGETQ